MKKLLTLLIACFGLIVSLDAQDFPVLKENTIYPQENRSTEISNSVLLELNLSTDFNLRNEMIISSKTAEHYHFTLLYKGKAIFAGRVHVVVDHNGKIKKINYNDVPLSTAEGKNFPLNTDEVLLQSYEAEEILASEEVWIPMNHQLVPGRLVELSAESSLHKSVLYTSESIAYEVDNVKHYSSGPKDSIVSALVFDPDPLTTAGVIYGAPYEDAGDSDVPELNAERKNRDLLVTYDSGIFILQNDYARIRDVSSPALTPVTSTTPFFHFTRSESGFEDVNALYHVTHFARHLHTLGFANIPGYRIDVDPHGLNGDDNSLFMSNSSPKRIIFGEGGVDDAEDADVLIHEFSHACILAASGNNNGSAERNTIEESLGDYFAASYSSMISGNYYNGVYNWDGQNTFWPGRKTSSNKDYQQLSFNDIYKHTDIWTSCLMEINMALGRDITDELVMEAIFNLGTNTTMPQMANHILDADEALNGGMNRHTIATAFIRRNILDSSALSFNEEARVEQTLQLLNSIDFANGGELMLITTENSAIRNINLYDLSGKPLVSRSYTGRVNSESISSASLAAGIYLLVVELEDGQKHNFKLIRN